MELSPFPRVLAFAACTAAGYFAASALVPPAPATIDARQTADGPVGELTPRPEDESEFIAEWKRFREQHGGPQEQYLALKEVPEGFRRRAFRSAIIADWTSADPKGALAFLQNKDAGQIEALAREWLRTDREAMISALLAGGKKEKEALFSMLETLAETTPPERLAEVVSALPKPESRWDTNAKDAFVLLAAKDLERARKAAESVTGPLRAQALAGIAEAQAEKDGPGAIAWAQTLAAGPERNEALTAALMGWAKNDPIGALDHIDAAPPGGNAMNYGEDTAAKLLRVAGRRDWDATLRWLGEHPDKIGMNSLNGLMETMSRRLTEDPAGLLRTLSQNTVPGLQWVLGNALLNDGYAAHNAIWDWLAGQPATDFTRSLRNRVVISIAYKEPGAAIPFLEGLPDTVENRPLFEEGTRALINGGRELARVDALLAHSTTRLRPYLIEAALENGVSGMVLDGPAGDLDPSTWLPRIAELPQNRQAGARAGLARAWGASDPEAALQWALALPNAPEREPVFVAAMSGWIAADLYGAAQAINGLPAGPNRDGATKELVTVLSESQPEDAWTWALSVQSPGQRAEALQTAYASLRKRDPAVAAQMLQGATLTATEREKLRQLQ